LSVKDVSIFSMDDIDVESLMSPPRVNHRRVRSDPSDFMRSLRAESLEEGESASSGAKRDLSPLGSPTGLSPALKKHASDASDLPSRPPSSVGDSDDTIDATSAEELDAKPKCVTGDV